MLLVNVIGPLELSNFSIQRLLIVFAGEPLILLGLTVKRVAGGYGQQEVESRSLIQACVHRNPDLRGDAEKTDGHQSGAGAI